MARAGGPAFELKFVGRVGQPLVLPFRVADHLVFKGPCFRLFVWVRRRGTALDDRVSRFQHLHVRARCPRNADLRDPTGQQEASFRLLGTGFSNKVSTMTYSGIITMEPGKRGGKPCVRGLRITVYDVLEYLASGMTHPEILREFPYLTEEDIRACLAYAADRERKLEISNA